MAGVCITKSKTIFAKDADHYRQPMGDFENLTSAGESRNQEFDINSYQTQRGDTCAAGSSGDSAITLAECGESTITLNTPASNSPRNFRLWNTGTVTLYAQEIVYYSKTDTAGEATTFTSTTVVFGTSGDRLGPAIPPGDEIVIPLGYVSKIVNPSLTTAGSFDWCVSYIDDVATVAPEF